MTISRILPNGARRRLPNGGVRAIGADGDRFRDVSGVTGLGANLGGGAVPTVSMWADGTLSIEVRGKLLGEGTLGNATLTMLTSGRIVSRMPLHGASTATLSTAGTLSYINSTRGITELTTGLIGHLVSGRSVVGHGTLNLATLGVLQVAARVAASTKLGLSTGGTLTSAAAPRWKNLWENLYATRQAVLNAIYENNRNLAVEAGDTAAATADAIILTDARVTETEAGVTALSQRIEQVNSSLSGKADSSALSATNAMVTALGDTVTAQSGRIDSVTAQIGDSPGNIIRKSDYSDGTAGKWSGAGVGDAPSSGWGSQGTDTYRGKYLSVTGGAYEEVWTPCTPGEIYDVAFNGFNTANSSGQLGLHFQTATGSNVTWVGVSAGAPGSWRKVTGSITVPSDAARMRPWVQGSTGGTNTLRVTQPNIQRRSSGTSALAQAVQTLDARVEQTEDGVTQAKASWGVYLTAGNLIGGVQSINDGVRSSFSVLASVFRVISNLVSAGMEWKDGYLRMWKGSAQLVMGHSFGAGDLVFWYGPNVGAGNCKKSNATIWFDTSGGAYFGGTLSAGVLKNAAQTTVLTANPTITVGPFTTNGHTKVVTVGYSANSPTYTQYYPGRPASSPPPPQAAPSVTATTLYLYRSYGGGSEVLATTSPISHSAIVTSEYYVERDAFHPQLPNGGWVQDYHYASGGSMTYSDTTAGVAVFQYRAYAKSGSYQYNRQVLSIVSVED